MPFVPRTGFQPPMRPTMEPNESAMYLDLASNLLQGGGGLAMMLPGAQPFGAAAMGVGQFTSAFQPLAQGPPMKLKKGPALAKAALRAAGPQGQNKPQWFERKRHDDSDEDSWW